MDNEVNVRTIEKQVADAILQQQMGVVTLRGKEYPVSHPSSATLIMISQLCADLPAIDIKGNILTEVLRTAKDCAVIGKIIAILILGAKRVKENHTIEYTCTRTYGSAWRRFLGIPDKQTVETKKVAEIDFFTEILLEDFAPSQLRLLAQNLFTYSEVVDFFALTTSLYEANLLRRTREVETASGE